MPTIKIFRAEGMRSTPFDERPLFSELAVGGVEYVKRPRQADIIVAQRPGKLTKFGRYDRAFVIWTHEPALSEHFDSIIQLEEVRNPVHVMNALTGDIYADEFYHFTPEKPDLDEAMRAFCSKPRRAVMLASYRVRSRPIIVDGRNQVLNQYRQGLALHLKDRGFCDIYGRKWPPSVQVMGNSRVGNWQAAKREILKGYAVNLAFENTIIRNYITEKLWDAVVGACLPVYHGEQNGIYRIFPRNSFIEAGDKSVEELGDEILAMPPDEMTARYEACLRSYLGVFEEDLRHHSRTACRVRTTRFLERVMETRASRPRKLDLLRWRRFTWRPFARRLHRRRAG